MSWRDYEYPAYVPVAERRAQAAREVAKRSKKGEKVAPVVIEGRKITSTFWGDAWCANLEGYSDFANRLPRGRTYVRNGSVVDLKIEKGRVKALVSGSDLYEIEIDIAPLSKERWQAIKTQAAGQIGSLVELLQGRLSKGVMELVTDRDRGLFPKPQEIELTCDCPDHAGLCKHLAAVMYGVGNRLDSSPELLFVLRGVDHAELIEEAIPAAPARSKRGAPTIAADDLGAIFDIELDEAPARCPKGRDDREVAARKEGRQANGEGETRRSLSSRRSPPSPRPQRSRRSLPSQRPQRSRTVAANSKASAKKAPTRRAATSPKEEGVAGVGETAVRPDSGPQAPVRISAKVRPPHPLTWTCEGGGITRRLAGNTNAEVAMPVASITRLLLFLWVLASALLGAARSASADGVEVRGKVVDAETGKPLTAFIEQGGLVREGQIEWGFTETRTEGPNPAGTFRANIDWAGGAPPPHPGRRLRNPDGPDRGSARRREDAGRGRRDDSGPHGCGLGRRRRRQAGGGRVGVPRRPAVGEHLGREGAAAGLRRRRRTRPSTRAATGADGTFRLTGSGEDVDRVVVSAPGLDLWVVPTPRRREGPGHDPPAQAGDADHPLRHPRCGRPRRVLHADEHLRDARLGGDRQRGDARDQERRPAHAGEPAARRILDHPQQVGAGRRFRLHRDARPREGEGRARRERRGLVRAQPGGGDHRGRWRGWTRRSTAGP